MKKLILSAAVAAAAIFGAYTANQTSNEVAMNDLAMDNIENVAEANDSYTTIGIGTGKWVWDALRGVWKWVSAAATAYGIYNMATSSSDAPVCDGSVTNYRGKNPEGYDCTIVKCGDINGAADCNKTNFKVLYL